MLGKAEAGAPLADVPVITQLQSQHSFVDYMEVPQIQLLHWDKYAVRTV